MDVNELKFDENSFDLVFLFEVLEHLPNPQNAIDQIYKVLKPSGIIFLSTPFALEIHGAPHDFYRFSKHGILHLLSRFKNIQIKERNTYFESINVLLIRLIQSNYLSDRIIGLFFLFLSIIFLPKTFIFNFFIRSKSLTTVYVCKANK